MPSRLRQTKRTGYTILVVDDQEAILWAMRRLLRREGHEVVTASSGSEALALLADQLVHVAVVDYVMPRMSAEELVPRIRACDPRIRVILQTGYAGSKPPRATLRELDIHGYHDKTDGPDKLLIWIDVAIKAYEQLRQVTEAADPRLLTTVVRRWPELDPLGLTSRIEALRGEAKTVRACAELLLASALRPEQAALADLIRAHVTTQLSMLEDVAIPVITPRPVA